MKSRKHGRKSSKSQRRIRSWKWWAEIIKTMSFPRGLHPNLQNLWKCYLKWERVKLSILKYGNYPGLSGWARWISWDLKIKKLSSTMVSERDDRSIGPNDAMVLALRWKESKIKECGWPVNAWKDKEMDYFLEASESYAALLAPRLSPGETCVGALIFKT